MGSKIFLSHAHQDKLICDRYHAKLVEKGFNLYYYHTFPAGRNISEEVRMELNDCSAFIAFLSPTALQSNWVLHESKYYHDLATRDGSRTMFSVIITPCIVPAPLNEWRNIDATTINFDQTMEEIIIAIDKSRGGTAFSGSTGNTITPQYVNVQRSTKYWLVYAKFGADVTFVLYRRHHVVLELWSKFPAGQTTRLTVDGKEVYKTDQWDGRYEFFIADVKCEFLWHAFGYKHLELVVGGLKII